MIAAGYYAWFALLAFVACVAGVVEAARYAARIVRTLAERFRHRRELRRWHASCAIHDHQLLAEADAIVRQAERRRT